LFHVEKHDIGVILVVDLNVVCSAADVQKFRNRSCTK
jgi:hypothetical protein